MKNEQPGPTGQYPEGKLIDRDEGELKIGVGTRDGRVILEFGAKIKWLGMRPSEARDIARLLFEMADSIDPGLREYLSELSLRDFEEFVRKGPPDEEPKE